MVAVVLAKVQGQPLLELPKDLYIPPDALEVLLETFEGPLDLLLYLIKKQNLAIVEIPIAEITRQFMNYIELMQALRLDLAAEYLVMAAILAEIKSMALLPLPPAIAEDAPDPRADLIQRLQEYERYQQAALQLEACPQVGRDIFLLQPDIPAIPLLKRYAPVALADITQALQGVLLRAERYAHHQVRREPLSVQVRMSQVLLELKVGCFVEFAELLIPEQARRGVVVTFLAVLELVKAALVEAVQVEPFSPLHIKRIEAA